MSLNRVIEVGTYVGNGGTNAISVGWQPSLVMTFARYGGNPNNRGWNIKSQDMTGDDLVSMNSVAELVTANGNTLGSDGFSLGSANTHNTNGNDYSYFALRMGAHCDHGSYTGGGGTQTITLGRQPIAVFIMQETGTSRVFFKFGSMSGSTALEFQTNATSQAAVTILSTGFQVTGNADTSSQTYGYVALYNDETIHWENGTYTGNGTSVTVTTGRQPRFLIAASLVGTLAVGAKLVGWATNSFGQLTGSFSQVGDGGFTLLSTGFSVDGDPNFNTDTEVNHYLVGYS